MEFQNIHFEWQALGRLHYVELFMAPEKSVVSGWVDANGYPQSWTTPNLFTSPCSLTCVIWTNCKAIVPHSPSFPSVQELKIHISRASWDHLSQHTRSTQACDSPISTHLRNWKAIPWLRCRPGLGLPVFLGGRSPQIETEFMWETERPLGHGHTYKYSIHKITMGAQGTLYTNMFLMFEWSNTIPHR